MKIAIIGKGNVGSALEAGLTRNGHDVQAVGRDPRSVREAAEAADIVILAIPFGAIDEAVGELGRSVSGKIVIDATNALTPDYELAVGFTTSGAEELQKKLPDSRVVKAFNTAFASVMDGGRIKSERLAGLVEQLGFDPIDAGPLAAARLLEPLAVLNIKLGFAQGYGPDSGFRLVH